MRNDANKHQKCLICERNRATNKRGLCTGHYLQWRRHMDKLTPEGQVELERKLITAKKLLPSRQGKRPGIVDPFQGMAQKLVAENPDFVKPSIPFHAEENDAAIEKYKKEKKPKKK